MNSKILITGANGMLAKEIKENPEEVLKHPLNTPVKKVDEVLAARKLDLAYKAE